MSLSSLIYKIRELRHIFTVSDCLCGTYGACDPSSTECVCNKGFTYVKSLREDRCVDIDECSLDRPCGSVRICINTEGSYKCQCPFGRWDGSQCLLGICDLGVNCDRHATCIEVNGTAKCECMEGYTEHGFTCVKGWLCILLLILLFYMAFC